MTKGVIIMVLKSQTGPKTSIYTAFLAIRAGSPAPVSRIIRML